jgi:hypothetical protein
MPIPRGTGKYGRLRLFCASSFLFFELFGEFLSVFR